MVLVMTPTAAFAEGDAETQPEAGAAALNGEGETVITLTENNISDYMLSGLTDGSYQLGENVTVESGSLEVKGTVTLDLNGHTLLFKDPELYYPPKRGQVNAGIRVYNSDSSESAAKYALTLCDTSTAKTGTLDVWGESMAESGEGLFVGQNGELTMTGGTITDSSGTNPWGIGIGIIEGRVTMTGGKIENQTRCGVTLAGGTFEMSGDAVISNCGSSNFGGGIWIGGGTFTMSGGTIRNCSAPQGGGVYVGMGTFTMSNGSIENCEAKATDFAFAMGGGVYVAYEGTFNMSGGSIVGCKVSAEDGDALGGGIRNDGTTTLSGTAEIRNCQAANNGGGISDGGTSEAPSTLNISGDVKITGCTVNGTPNAMIVNNGTISGGTFDGQVTNDGMITGGTFNGQVTNDGTITGGTFNGQVTNDGTITGGTFYAGNPGTIAEDCCTVTYKYPFEETYAIQIVQKGNTAIRLTDPVRSDFTFDNWYVSPYPDNPKQEPYDFDTLVEDNLFLYGNWANTFYGIHIADKNGDVYNITDKNAGDVLGNGTVVYTPGYANENITYDDWEKVLSGETVEGLQLPKLTLNGANLRQIEIDTIWISNPDMKLFSMMLQLELVGNNTVEYNGNSDAAISADYLIVTGSGSLNAAATGENATAIAISNSGGGYYQHGGDVTLNGSSRGLLCSDAYFEFAAGKLTAISSKSALYCDTDDRHFKITSDTTTFFCGTSKDDVFEMQHPFNGQSIYEQLYKKGYRLTPFDGYSTVTYAQLTSNHTVTFDTDGGSAVKAQTVAYGETVTKPAEDPVRSGYTFEGWYLGENAYNFDAPVTEDLTVTAHWRYNGGGSSYTYHTIRASVNANGSITPSGTISVREGSDQTFTITPDQGYDVADVKIDGKSIGVVRSYTFEKIKGSHTIEVKIDREEVIKQAKAKELTASIVLTARSVKTAKKNVKVRLEMDAESAAAIRELQALGYTVKYKFYRSEKKAGQYEAKLTKTSKAYINTQGEKGKRYYYKARVLIYDPSGKPVTYSKLTQCKYAARLWTK